MAYLAPTQDQDEKDKKAQGEADPNAPLILSGESAAAPSASGTTTANSKAANGTPAGTSSGTFTNLQKYIGANQGNDAAMGGAVQGNAQNKATSADTAGDSFKSTADSAINANTVKDNGVIGALGKIGQGSGSYQAATDKATGDGVINSNDFNKEYNASYKGPKTAEDVAGFGDTQGAYNKVDQYGSLAGGGFSDKGALLSDVYGKDGKQYNGGERRLDSFILGSGKGGTDALNNIANTYGNYSQNFGKIQDAIKASADTGAATTAATAQGVQQAAKGALGGVEGRLGQASDAATQATNAATKQYQQLTGGNADAWKAAGLDQAAIDYLSGHNANFGDYVGQNHAYSVGDFANGTDTGNYTNLLNLLNGANSGVAGKYTPDQFTKTGSGPAVRQDVLDNANKLGDEYAALTQAAAAKQAQNAAALQSLTGQLSHINDVAPTNGFILTQPNSVAQKAALAGKLGISAQDLNDALANNLDVGKYVSAGNPVGLGDVATAGQLGDFSNLSSLLGINNDVVAGNNSAINFDKTNFGADLNAARQKAAAATSQLQVARPGVLDIDPGTNPVDVSGFNPNLAPAVDPNTVNDGGLFGNLLNMTASRDKG